MFAQKSIIYCISESVEIFIQLDLLLKRIQTLIQNQILPLINLLLRIALWIMHSPNCFLDNKACRKFHTIIFKSTTIQLNFRSVKYDNDDEIFSLLLFSSSQNYCGIICVDFSLRLKIFVKLIPGRTHTNTQQKGKRNSIEIVHRI